MKRVQNAIINNNVDVFLKDFLTGQFNGLTNVPEWVKEAVTYMGHSSIFETDK